MIGNKNRVGNFTSSQVYRLMGAPKPCATYIAECNLERKLSRSLGTEVFSKPTAWGKHCEKRVFDLLDIDYTLCSQETILHPEISFWAGSPDGVRKDAVIDIKCPYTLKSFCELVEIKSAEDLKADYPDYYWQLVSNAILTGKTIAELIVYAPYESELNTLRKMCEDVSPDELRNVYWINNSLDEELPFLIDGGTYKNVNVLRFDISTDDIEKLTETIKEKGKLLI